MNKNERLAFFTELNFFIFSIKQNGKGNRDSHIWYIAATRHSFPPNFSSSLSKKKLNTTRTTNNNKTLKLNGTQIDDLTNIRVNLAHITVSVLTNKQGGGGKQGVTEDGTISTRAGRGGPAPRPTCETNPCVLVGAVGTASAAASAARGRAGGTWR